MGWIQEVSIFIYSFCLSFLILLSGSLKDKPTTNQAKSTQTAAVIDQSSQLLDNEEHQDQFPTRRSILRNLATSVKMRGTDRMGNMALQEIHETTTSESMPEGTMIAETGRTKSKGDSKRKEVGLVGVEV